MILETAKRDASLSYLRTPSAFQNKKHKEENFSRAGGSSSSSRGKSIKETLNVDDYYNDDDINNIIFVDHEEHKTKPSKERYCNGTFSDDSDQPILELIAKRKRLSLVEKEKEMKARKK